MPVISFRFSPAADRPTQDRLLVRLKHAPGVKTAGRIDPESPDAEISRMCFAETTDPSATASVVDELHRASGVETGTVSVESRRGLA